MVEGENKMKDEIKANVQLTLEEYKKYALYIAYRKGKGLRLKYIIVYLIAAAFTIYLLADMFVYGFDVYRACLVAVWLLLPVYALVLNKIRIKRNYYKAMSRETTSSYVFSSQLIYVDTTSNHISGRLC
jgi:hypothetical protein